MQNYDDDEITERSFFRRNRTTLIIAAVFVPAAGYVISKLGSGDSVTQYQAVMDVLNVVGSQGITQVGLATAPSR
jgi:hypothetical protein